jgi:aminoglycoside phosphotransferase (APT) family kinase protein
LKQSVDQQVIRSVLHTLTESIAPAITDPPASAALGMSLQLLAVIAQGEPPSTATAGLDTTDWVRSMSKVAEEARHLERAMSVPPRSQRPSQPITVDVLQPYVRKRLRGGAKARVSALNPSLGGFSKETYIVVLEDSEIERIVIRRDPLGGPVERTAAEEFPILRAAFEHGVRVPEPLWSDAAAPFGRSVVVTRFAAGRSAFDLTGSTIDADQAPAAIALARELAHVHGMPLTTAELQSGMQSASIAVHVRGALARLEDQWHRRRIWQSDILQAAFAWMREHIPESSPRAVVVHGDASLRNLLMQGDQATALLDWELWHVGDPVEDLAYCRPDVERVLPWKAFMAEYRASGGVVQWNAAADAYYGLWSSLRNAVLCASCLHGFVEADAPEPRMAFAGIIHYRRLLLDVARRLSSLTEESA